MSGWNRGEEEMIADETQEAIVVGVSGEVQHHPGEGPGDNGGKNR